MTVYVGRFQQLAKPASEWTAANPVLLNGEIGVSDPGTSTPVLKIGDGVRQWSVLPQISGAGGGSPNYIVGSTTTLAPGAFATVTIDNTTSPPTISFGIPNGAAGPPNTLAIGTVTNGASGTPAAATITGTAPTQTLNLTLPMGPQGDPGTPGADGATGPAGAAGGTGPANTLAIGTVTTAAPGGAAAATITGTAPTQTLNLTIPTGADGAAGAPGATGATGAAGAAGPANTLTIGTVTTGAPGSAASATVTGTAPAQTLNLTIPRGDVGAGSVGGNPSALVGLSNIDGVSTQFMRSDAAPALNQGIAPTWTALHTFSNAIVVGAPTGGSQGAGTINATGLYINGVAVSTGAGAVGANPSALVGLATINGAAVTFMRSDAAPALNQAIVPTWTGAHSFNAVGSSTAAGASVTLASASPILELNDTGQGLNAKRWVIRATGSTFFIRALADDGSVARAAMAAYRAGNAVTQLDFGNATDSPPYTFLGTGTVTAGGAFLGASGSAGFPTFAFSGDVNTGMYSFSADVLGLSTAGTVRAILYGSAFELQNGCRFWTVDGDVSLPAIAFANDTNTGMFRPGADEMRFVVGGAGAFGAESSQVYALLPLRGLDGTASAPGFSFTSDADTGVYHMSADQFGFTTGGTRRGYFYNSGFVVEVPLRVLDGTASAPTYTFDNDTNSGLYRIGADTLGISAGGTLQLEIQNGGTVVRSGLLYVQDGAVGGPGLVFVNDQNCGLYRITTDTVGIAAGGVEAARFTSAGVSSASFTSTSCRSIKRETGAPRRAADTLARLRPILYRLLENDDREQLGLIAEEVHEVCPQLSDGRTVSYDRLALLLLADWQESRAAA